jgi:hypothetical protein
MTRLAAGLRALAREYPRMLGLVWGVALLLVAGDLWLVTKRVAYARETSRLRDGMTSVERSRLDAALASDSNRLQVMIELARRQSRGDIGLHLSVALDSGVLYLEQEGATLRTVRAEIAPDVWVRTTKRDSVRIAAPRGTRTIERVLDDTTIVLNGGATIYARLAADTGAAPRPGSVRVGALDLRVLRPSLRPGQRVYFY